MGWRANVALLVVVGGLSGTLYLALKNKRAGDGGGTGLTTRALDGLRAGDAKRIRFQRSQRTETIELQRVSGRGFMVTEPVRDLASEAFLQTLVSAFDFANLLTGYSAEEIAADPELWAKTKLLKPRAWIEFRFAEKNIKLWIGGEGPYGDEIWLRKGDAIYRADPVLHSVLQVHPDDARERVIFPVRDLGSFDVVHVERILADEEPEVSEIRLRNGVYRLSLPRDMRVDPFSVRDLIGLIQRLQVRRFLGGRVAHPLGPQLPLAYLIRIQGSGASEEMQIRRSPNGRYVASLVTRGIVFELDQSGDLSYLDDLTGRLRARLLLPVPESQITRIELDWGEGSKRCIMERGAGSAFKLKSPVLSNVRASPVKQLLDGLLGLEVKTFLDEPGKVDPGKSGLGQAALTLRVHAPALGGPITVLLGRDQGELSYARRADEDYLALVPKAAVDLIRQPWTNYVSHNAYTLQTEPFRLELQRPGSLAPLVYNKVEGKWRQEGSDKVDEGLGDFVEMATDLEAKAVLALDEVSLGEPVVLRFMREAKSSDVILELRLYLRGKEVLVVPKDYVGGVVYVAKWTDVFLPRMRLWTGK